MQILIFCYIHAVCGFTLSYSMQSDFYSLQLFGRCVAVLLCMEMQHWRRNNYSNLPLLGGEGEAPQQGDSLSG